MAGGPAEAAGHYARAVVSAAYRRGLYAAGAAITQAATERPKTSCSTTWWRSAGNGAPPPTACTALPPCWCRPECRPYPAH